MISNQIMDYSIKIPYGKEIIFNSYIYHMEDTYKILEKINKEEIPFFSDAYSLLANTMERFYKGLAIELQKLHPDVNMHLENIAESHYFKIDAAKVNKFLPLSNSKMGYFKIIESCERIYDGYTNSKYTDMYELSDFKVDFLRLSFQRERLFRALDMEITKCKLKSDKNFNFNEQENNINNQEEDLEFWK